MDSLSKQINGLKFLYPVKPSMLGYRFKVTSISRTYEGKDIISNYDTYLPDDDVTLVKQDGSDYYILEVDEDAFQELEEKAEKLGCDIYLYPGFNHD